MLTSRLYNALWYNNGKKMTVLSYVYAGAGIICLLSGSLTETLLFTVLSEQARVDKASRFLSLAELDSIIAYFDDEADKQ